MFAPLLITAISDSVWNPNLKVKALLSTLKYYSFWSGGSKSFSNSSGLGNWDLHLEISVKWVASIPWKFCGKSCRLKSYCFGLILLQLCLVQSMYYTGEL